MTQHEPYKLPQISIMKYFLLTVMLIILLVPGFPAQAADYRHFYGIAWRGSTSDNIKYAKQMGYHYVAYQADMQKKPEAANLRFYLVDPEYYVMPTSRTLSLVKDYSLLEKAGYEKSYAWKSDTAQFPYNIASGWWWDGRSFSVAFDFQQQSVINSTVEAIIAKAKSYENFSINFTFAGLMWDIPNLTGDFWSGLQTAGGNFVTLAYWTGKDSCAATTHTHDYSTYSAGRAAYYSKLYQRVKEEFPDAKFIAEPWDIYNDWIKNIKDRTDAVNLMPDMLIQESPGTAFVDDERIVNSGLAGMDRIGLTTPSTFGEYENRLYVAKAAINGAWVSWFGRFGGNTDMPDYANIYEVPARLQLIRMLPNWDNLVNVPLMYRSWDGHRYESSNSYTDSNIIYSRHPYSGKIFVVFLNTNGVIKLLRYEKADSIYRTDGLFIESEDGSSDVQIGNEEIRLLNSANIGKGYIITTNRRGTYGSDPLPPKNVRIEIGANY